MCIGRSPRLRRPGSSRTSAALLVATLFVQVLGAGAAAADVVPAGRKRAEYCVRFAGLESLPEWKFLASTVDTMGRSLQADTPRRATEVGPGTCLGIHSLALGSYDIELLALPQEEFSGDLSAAYADAGYPRGRVRVERGLRERNDSVLTLPDRVWVDEKSTLARVEEVVEVKGIDDTRIVLKKGKRRHVYPDGSVKVAADEGTAGTWGAAAGALAILSLAALKAVKARGGRSGKKPRERT